MTSRAELQSLRNVLGFLAAVAIAFGVFHGVRSLVVFGLTGVILALALWLYAGLVAASLRVVRELPSRAIEDQAVQVRLRLSNAWPVFAVAPSVEDFFKPDGSPHKEILALPGLLGREAAKLSYRGLCYSGRGLFELDQLAVVGRDPLGLFERRRRLELRQTILVYPQAEELFRSPWSGLNPARGLGQSSTESKGRSALTLGVREYRAGDPLRFIHWPTSARRGRLVVREFDRPTLPRSAIFLALNPEEARGLGRQSNLELALRSAATLSRYVLGQGELLEVFVQGAKDRHLSALSSPTQLSFVLEELALTRADFRAELWGLVDREASRLAKGTTQILIIPNSEGQGERILEGCVRLQSLGYALVVVLIDASQFPALRRRTRSPAAERAGVITLVEKLLRLGISVGRLGPSGDITAAFERPLPPRIRVRPRRLEPQS